MTESKTVPPVLFTAPPENGNGGLFYYPEEVVAAYEAAEYKIHHLVLHGKLLIPSNSVGGSLGVFTQRDIYIKQLAREIADAVIRTVPDWTVPQGDIADIPGVKVERV
jgi:hypothetical protein